MDLSSGCCRATRTVSAWSSSRRTAGATCLKSKASPANCSARQHARRRRLRSELLPEKFLPLRRLVERRPACAAVSAAARYAAGSCDQPAPVSLPIQSHHVWIHDGVVELATVGARDRLHGA